MVARHSEGEGLSPVGDGPHGVTVQGERREGTVQEDQGKKLLPCVLAVDETLVGPGVNEDVDRDPLLLPGESGGELGGVRLG